MKSTRPRTPAAILTVPALLAVLTAAGLAAALFGDGLFDIASWIALTVPIVAAGYFGIAKR